MPRVTLKWGDPCCGIPGLCKSKTPFWIKVLHQRINEFHYLQLAGIIDLVKVVAGPVVVGMNAGKEEEYGNVFLIKRGVVAGAEAAAVVVEGE